jgi:hypothetical protein
MVWYTIETYCQRVMQDEEAQAAAAVWQQPRFTFTARTHKWLNPTLS